MRNSDNQNMTPDRLEDILAGLYRQCPPAGEPYLAEHASGAFVAAQVRTFRWYRRHLPPAGRILDWGCRHAPDACLVRAELGDGVSICGCDFVEPVAYRPFHEFAHLEYSRLTHPAALPYRDGEFDAVIASGVLEHAAWDHESLKELWRCLRVGGVLIVTYLPNRLSYEEFLKRIGRREHHLRRYGLREFRGMLLHWGFVPLEIGYQARSGVLGRGGGLPGLRARLAHLAGLHRFTACLCAAARKVETI